MSVAHRSIAHRALVADAYHRAAPWFARSADPLIYRTLARPLVEAMTELIGSRSGPVLDVAAGAGALGSSFPDVVAVDIAAGQLAANPASRRVRGDAEHLPFQRDAFAAAGCGFGVNHLLRPARAIREMARVAPVVGLSTWLRPERWYAPKDIVHAALERHAGRSRTPVGESLDRLSDRVGSIEALTGLLTAAGLEARVWAVEVEVPWPGLDDYVAYRLSMPSTPPVADRVALRDEVAEAVNALPADELRWRPMVLIGTGIRESSR